MAQKPRCKEFAVQQRKRKVRKNHAAKNLRRCGTNAKSQIKQGPAITI